MFKELKNGEKNQIKRLDIKTTRGQEETLGEDEYVIMLPVVMVSQVHTYLKTQQMYTLNRCGLLHVNYTSKLSRERDWVSSGPTLSERDLPVTRLQLKARVQFEASRAQCTQSKHSLLQRQIFLPPISLFSNAVLSADSSKYKNTTLSLFCCYNPSLRPPTTLLRTTTLPSGMCLHPFLLLLPFLSRYFL